LIEGQNLITLASASERPVCFQIGEEGGILFRQLMNAANDEGFLG
jgi:hypothetical protein